MKFCAIHFFCLFLLPIFSKQHQYTNNGQNLGDIQIQLNADDSFIIQFTQPYGIVLIPYCQETTIEYQINDKSSGFILNETKYIQNSKDIQFFGVYLHKYIGTVKISTFSNLMQSILWAVFPSDCTYKYFTNMNTTITFPNGEFIDNASFCLLNAGVSPIDYEIEYDISRSKDPLDLTFYANNTNTTFKISDKGTISRNFNQVSLLQISNLTFHTNSHLTNTEFLNIESTNSNSQQPPIPYDGLILYDKPSFIILDNDNNNFPKSKPNTQMIIIIATIASFALLFVVVVIVYKCLMKQKHVEIEIEKEIKAAQVKPTTSDGIKRHDVSRSDSADSYELFKIQNFKDELLPDNAAYPENNYNPSNIEYKVPKPNAVKTFLKHIKGEV